MKFHISAIYFCILSDLSLGKKMQIPFIRQLFIRRTKPKGKGNPAHVIYMRISRFFKKELLKKSLEQAVKRVRGISFLS